MGIGGSLGKTANKKNPFNMNNNAMENQLKQIAASMGMGQTDEQLIQMMSGIPEVKKPEVKKKKNKKN